MSHFIAYNTEDPNAEAMGYTPLKKANAEGHILELPAQQTDRAQKIVGSVFADQAGTLLVQQSFDGEHWDIEDSISVEASKGAKIEIDIIAPVWRLKFTNTAETAQKKFRLFARAFTSGN